MTLAAFALASAFEPSSEALQLKKAQVSQVVREVDLLPTQAPPQRAKVSDEVRDGTAVRTGAESRAELTFTDATLARLGANTIFSFSEGTRNLQLGGGAMLLRVPKDAGGARINTAAVTAAITGTTIMLEYHPDAYIKFIVLEGTGRIFRNDRLGESVLLRAGQMLIVNPKGLSMPDPVEVDIGRLRRTSRLINGFRSMPSDDLISREVQHQLAQRTDGELVDTNLVIFGGGTAVTLLDPSYVDRLDQANGNENPGGTQESPAPSSSPTPTPAHSATPTPTPTLTPTPTATATPTVTPFPTPTPTATPTPSATATATPTPPDAEKYGTPPVIASPAPYTINRGTVIETDPTITTNGQTDFGKIYRGPADDGTPSTYLFGTTNDFDTSSGFDEHFSTEGNAPMAAFKFSALILAGNPTISFTNGGVDRLALISVGSIFPGPSAATFTFDGLASLLLATENGSINLGSNISFANIPALFIYARGAESTLAFDSAVTGSTDFVLLSEHDIQFNRFSGAVEAATAAGDALNFSFGAGRNLNAAAGLSLTLDSSSGSAESADITINVGGDFTATRLDLLIANGEGGFILGPAGIFVNAASLSTGDSTMVIDNQDGTIGGEATISLNVAGAATVLSGNYQIITSTGSAIGGNASITLAAGSYAATDSFAAQIFAAGGDIGGTRSISISVDGALSSGGDATVQIFRNTLLAGNSISIDAGSIDIAGNFIVGMVDGESRIFDGDISVTTAGNLTVGGDFQVDGLVNAGGDITVGGTFSVPTLATAGGSITSGSIFGRELNAAGDITLVDSNGGAPVLFVNTLTAGGSLNLMNVAEIHADTGTGTSTVGNTPDPLTLNIDSIVRTGLNIPAIIGDGADADPLLSGGNPGNGGNITLNLTAGGLTIGAEGDLSSISANGGRFTSGAIFDGGNGGTVAISASGDVTLNDGNITATSGVNPTGTPAGNGGTVNVTSTTGTVTIGSQILVSSNSSGSAAVLSKKGGNINLTSNRSSGVAINVQNSGQLLALLNAAATGPGGKVTILATGANSSIDAKGNIQADRGTIDIRHTGANGTISTGSTPDSLNAHADVVKVGALGASGTLTIGAGSLTADSLLKLYAPGSNGTLNFIANATISSGIGAILAAKTITIQPRVIVNVQGNGGPAQVYTTNPNYSGFGGTNPNNGTFGGNGANNPLPLNQAPPFDAPPGG